MLGKKENEILLGIIWLSKIGSSAQHNRREGTSNNQGVGVILLLISPGARFPQKFISKSLVSSSTTHNNTTLPHIYYFLVRKKKMHSCQWSCVKIAPLLGEKSCLRPKNLEKRGHAKKYPCLFSLASLLSQSINENIFFPQPDNCLHTYSTTNLTNPNSRTGAQYCSIDYSAQVSVTRASNRHHHHELDPFSIHHQIKRSRALFVVKAQFFHEKSLVNQC